MLTSIFSTTSRSLQKSLALGPLLSILRNSLQSEPLYVSTLNLNISLQTGTNFDTICFMSALPATVRFIKRLIALSTITSSDLKEALFQ